MATLAAHAAVIDVSTDDSNWYAVQGANDVSFSTARDELETTCFDGAAIHTRIAGLTDGTFTIAGDFDDTDHAGDANSGWGTIRQQRASGGNIYIRIRWDGTNGNKVTCKCTSLNCSAVADGKWVASASFQFNSAITTVS